MVTRPRLAPVLANARPAALLGHDFMTLQSFPGFHNPMALWFCGSMVPRPRSKGPEAEEECGGTEVLEAATSNFLFAYEVRSQQKGDQCLN